MKKYLFIIMSFIFISCAKEKKCLNIEELKHQIELAYKNKNKVAFEKLIDFSGEIDEDFKKDSINVAFLSFEDLPFGKYKGRYTVKNFS